MVHRMNIDRVHALHSLKQNRGKVFYGEDKDSHTRSRIKTNKTTSACANDLFGNGIEEILKIKGETYPLFLFLTRALYRFCSINFAQLSHGGSISDCHINAFNSPM